MYSGEFGNRSASRSPTAKPLAASAAAMFRTRSWTALERNSGTVDNQRRALRVVPGCPAERMNVDHVLLTPCDTCAPLTP